MIVTGATEIRDSSKRTADSIGLNESREMYIQVREGPACRSVRRSQSLRKDAIISTRQTIPTIT